MAQDFPQYTVELFGKSIYQIRLELAMGFYLQGGSVADSWLKANEFIKFMETYYQPKNSDS